MLMSQEARNETKGFEAGSIELTSMENPMRKTVEELKKMEDSDMKALMKTLLINYERMCEENNAMRKDIEHIKKDNEILRRNNEVTRKQVDRLISIIDGNSEHSPTDESFGAFYGENKIAEKPLPAGWQTFQTLDGHTYYCGPDGTTTWEPP